MESGSVVESLAQATYTALIMLPPLEMIGRRGDEANKRMREPNSRDIDIYHFPQTWGSGALGFGGMGTSAMTRAYTTVVSCREAGIALIFFAGRFAYQVMLDGGFRQCVESHRFPSVDEAAKGKLLKVIPYKQQQ